jgi:hypothetical protein
MRTGLKVLLLIACVLALCGGVVGKLLLAGAPAASEGIQAPTAKQFAEGDFIIRVAKDAKPDAASRTKVLAIMEWARASRQAAESQRNAVGEERLENLIPAQTMESMYSLEYYVHNACLWEICNQTTRSESNFTAVLLLARLLQDQGGKAYVPVLDALRTIRRDHPNVWQAKIATLMECEIVLAKLPPVGRRERCRNAVILLREALPDTGFALDSKNPEVSGFLETWPCEESLRAKFLGTIAEIQYSAAITEKPHDFSFFDAAKETCDQIIKEFPGTALAKKAERMRDTDIPKLRDALQDKAKLSSPLKGK